MFVSLINTKDVKICFSIYCGNIRHERERTFICSDVILDVGNVLMYGVFIKVACQPIIACYGCQFYCM